MFATVVILLPSPYSGGQVHVSHASSTKILDMAPTSLLSTSVLAWYTDVRHEVKPITSGYRLALSYNLIHTSRGVPKPSLPDMNTALKYLRHVLCKWRKGAYEIDADRDIIAYLLKHEYSEANLAFGAKTLKGEDAHKIANLRIVAEELGYMVCLAKLSYHVTGVADDDFGYRDRGWKRGRYGYSSYDHDDDDDGEVPSMMEVTETTLKVTNLVDLEGHLLLGQHTALPVDEHNLIPKDPFEDVEPDDKDYEGYMGNVSCSFSILSWTSNICVTGCWVAGTLSVVLHPILRRLTNSVQGTIGQC
jgi:hypothetical protein